MTNLKTRIHTLKAIKEDVQSKIQRLEKEIKQREELIFNMQNACLLLEKISEEEV